MSVDQQKNLKCVNVKNIIYTEILRYVKNVIVLNLKNNLKRICLTNSKKKSN
jgi:hypothetical protein